jgi:dihydroorotate dehydrogenase (fumarate)
MLLVGADVVMLASALLRHGPRHIETVLDGITSWMADRGYESIEQLRGSMSQANVPNPVAFARANYAQLVTSFVSPYDWRMAPQEGELRA